MSRILIYLSCLLMICSLGVAQQKKAGGDAAKTLTPGKYNCYIFMSNRPILADVLNFAPGGSYTTRGGGAKSGRYELDAKTSKVKVYGGPIDGAEITLEAKGAIRVLHKENRGSSNPKWASMFCSPASK